MNYHPVITLYSSRWGELSEYGCERTVEVLRESLHDHKKIMDVAWRSMADAIVAFTRSSKGDQVLPVGVDSYRLYLSFNETYRLGWRDHAFKGLIQEIVNGVDVEDVPLEDFL